MRIGGTAVTNFRLAVDRNYKREGQPTADFIPVVIFGKQAESTAQYVGKGKMVGVSGRLQVRSYDAKDGSKRYVSEVIADEVKFLEWAEKTDNYNTGSFTDLTPIDDSDIPF